MTFKNAKKTLGSLLVAAIVLASPSLTWGKEKPRVIAIENKCGLEVKVPQKTIDLGNLNPGDSKQSRIQVSNKGSNDITLFMRTNILDETTLNGGYLADIMDLSINIKKDMIAENSLREVADQGNILIGILKPGASKTIELATFLPGEGTGNQYQGAYMKVNWTFVTQCASLEDKEETGDPDGGGGSTGGNTDENAESDTGVIEDPTVIPEEITIENEPLPLGTVEPIITNETIGGDDPSTKDDPTKTNDPTIIIEDEKIPSDAFKMPKTGELASFYYYGIGSVLMMLGLYLKKKKG